MRVLDDRQGKARQGTNQTGIGRDNSDEWLKTGFEKAARGLADQWLTTPRFQQLLASEPRRLPGGEQNPGDQTAGVAALSSWSTQLANRWAMR